MDQKQSSEIDSEPRAQAAYELLRSLARAGEDPDQFAQACLDWSRLSDDATRMPDFLSVLALLSDKAQTSGPASAGAPDPEIDADEVFSITPTGEIARISKALSDRFGLNEGDLVAADALKTDPADAENDARVIELTDRFAIKRQVKIYPVLQGKNVSGFIAYLVLTKLSPAVREHLRTQFGLTHSEIEILQLIMQRHSLDQIAEIRRGKLNTVRTHVAHLNSKMQSHSLVETVSTAIEIAAAVELRSPSAERLKDSDESAARRISLNQPGTRMEYRRYGSASGHPVIILHSIEYGYMPSQRMIEAARARHLNLIFPIRPGFGDTNATETLPEAADLIADFIRVLKLEDVTLIGLSTAAPLALRVQDRNARIGQTLLVNYGLNVQDKLKGIQPTWIRGLLRMALSSSTSFNFGVRTLRSMLRTFGGKRFYRMLYRAQSSDADYVEANQDQFASMAGYIATADRNNSRLDLQSAFLPNPDLETLLARAGTVRVLNSTEQHGVGPEESQADAERLGVEFRHIEHAGRNWMFQHPETLFAQLLS